MNSLRNRNNGEADGSRKEHKTKKNSHRFSSTSCNIKAVKTDSAKKNFFPVKVHLIILLILTLRLVL